MTDDRAVRQDQAIFVPRLRRSIQNRVDARVFDDAARILEPQPRNCDIPQPGRQIPIQEGVPRPQQADNQGPRRHRSILLPQVLDEHDLVALDVAVADDVDDLVPVVDENLEHDAVRVPGMGPNEPVALGLEPVFLTPV